MTYGTPRQVSGDPLQSARQRPQTAWKKAEPVWDLAIALGMLPYARPALEAVLGGTRSIQRAFGPAEAVGA